jgi:hypothetical protein
LGIALPNRFGLRAQPLAVIDESPLSDTTHPAAEGVAWLLASKCADAAENTSKNLLADVRCIARLES